MNGQFYIAQISGKSQKWISGDCLYLKLFVCKILTVLKQKLFELTSGDRRPRGSRSHKMFLGG